MRDENEATYRGRGGGKEVTCDYGLSRRRSLRAKPLLRVELGKLS